MLKLIVEDIPDEDAIELLFDKLRQYDWINTVTIQSGSVLRGKVEKRHFAADRWLDDVANEREMTLARLDKESIKQMREELDRLERDAS